MKLGNVYINEGGKTHMSGLELEKILKLAKVGDSDAFGELYTQYFEKVFKYLFYRVSHKETAEDLTEEVFVKAQKRLGMFEGNSQSFSAWLMVIARNLLIDYYRKKEQIQPLDDHEEYLPDTSENAVDFLLASDDQKALMTAMSQLPDQYREVLQMRFLEEYSIEDVAQVLKTSQGNVRVIQFRGLKKLKDIFEGIA